MVNPRGDRDSLLRRFADSTELQARDDGLEILWSTQRAMLRPVGAELGALLRALQGGWQLVEALLRSQGVLEDRALCAMLAEVITRLETDGLLAHAVAQGEEILLELHPLAAGHTFAPRAIPLSDRFLLSRFALCHREGTTLTLDSPLGHAKILLRTPRAAALCAALCTPSTILELAEVTLLPPRAVADCLTLLASAGCLADEDDKPPLLYWAPHDLMFHARSRAGRHDQPLGATYRFGAAAEPPGDVRDRPSGPALPLFRPDLARLMSQDAPFTRVLETRRSVRAFGHTPLSLEQLGEFLYRSARYKGQIGDKRPGPRPYPAAGGIYELEVYVVSDCCNGLAAGMYHYDPYQHALVPRSALSPACQWLVHQARRATTESAQVLLVLAARFPRMFFKYQSIGYSLILKDVGVLQQTMSLVAAAMNLGVCIAGCGDSDVFREALGSDYFEETSVGELVLGTLN